MSEITTPKFFAARGVRVGSQLSIPDSSPYAAGGVRHVINGKISETDQRALAYLAECGYVLIECDDADVFDEQAVALRERNAERLVSVDANGEKARNAAMQAEAQQRLLAAERERIAPAGSVGGEVEAEVEPAEIRPLEELEAERAELEVQKSTLLSGLEELARPPFNVIDRWQLDRDARGELHAVESRLNSIAKEIDAARRLAPA